ncbi:unnamed protein product [Rotaria sp. Silwood1]|nr:unnamed protein product [Rotaria sp. Silwood1]CAF3542866.1 unnamed protein product [Rotaria sp. Silwood1]
MSTSPFTIVSLALLGFILNSICMIDICNNKSNGFDTNYTSDYRHPQIYNSIDKRPCWLTPSYRHKENGLYGNQIQECSSYYERKDKRFVSSIKCPTNMRFSDKYKICLFTLFNCKNKTIYQF